MAARACRRAAPGEGSARESPCVSRALDRDDQRRLRRIGLELLAQHRDRHVDRARLHADGLSHHEWMKNIHQAEMKLKPADVRSGAYLGALEMIRSGTTAFADMYIYEDEVARAGCTGGISAC